ncbi:hypothetical protein E2C01_074941 [Portunus trituberculatus]|uniref:Uncharacterized protein n=1 Tax=Portunus trituberculatus TaxID=210409 RepID=A0A5B7IDL8_PORTR|nr:hypothetical protein [Portunus trituberculatus]
MAEIRRESNHAATDQIGHSRGVRYPMFNARCDGS